MIFVSIDWRWSLNAQCRIDEPSGAGEAGQKGSSEVGKRSSQGACLVVFLIHEQTLMGAGCWVSVIH